MEYLEDINAYGNIDSLFDKIIIIREYGTLLVSSDESSYGFSK